LPVNPVSNRNVSLPPPPISAGQRQVLDVGGKRVGEARKDDIRALARSLDNLVAAVDQIVGIVAGASRERRATTDRRYDRAVEAAIGSAGIST